MLNKMYTLSFTAVAAALLAAPVFAGGPMPMMHMPTMDVNVALIKSDTQAMANTGSNLQLSSVEATKAHVDDIKIYGHNYLRTGDAIATANSTITANKQIGCDLCGWSRHGTDIKLDIAAVHTTTVSLADTGNNQQVNSVMLKKAGADDITISAHNTMKTGDATATSNSWTVVNSNWSGWNN